MGASANINPATALQITTADCIYWARQCVEAQNNEILANRAKALKDALDRGAKPPTEARLAQRFPQVPQLHYGSTAEDGRDSAHDGDARPARLL